MTYTKRALAIVALAVVSCARQQPETEVLMKATPDCGPLQIVLVTNDWIQTIDVVAFQNGSRAMRVMAVLGPGQQQEVTIPAGFSTPSIRSDDPERQAIPVTGRERVRMRTVCAGERP